jgi:hypothetical protein
MAFPLELDHVVLFAAVDAPEAQTLEALGLTGFGGTTRHGDLGTASTSFFFENTYLELLWVQDAAAAARTFLPLDFDLQARINWRTTGAVPFGIMLRRTAGATKSIPFPTRPLKAGWMPGDVEIHFAAGNLAEPYYGVVPPDLAYPGFQSTIPALPHKLGVKRLTGIKFSLPTAEYSLPATLLAASGTASFEMGAAPHLDLEFDGGAQGRVVDAADVLPLRLVC